VVYYRRPGGQSQFSALLEMERANGRFAALLDHVRGHLEKRHSVADLAEHVAMSPRHFSRAFLAETGMSPAKAVEQLRAETARGSLAGTGRSVREIARSCGFGNAERMRRTFLRLFGVTPSGAKYRRLSVSDDGDENDVQRRERHEPSGTDRLLREQAQQSRHGRHGDDSRNDELARKYP